MLCVLFVGGTTMDHAYLVLQIVFIVDNQATFVETDCYYLKMWVLLLDMSLYTDSLVRENSES